MHEDHSAEDMPFRRMIDVLMMATVDGKERSQVYSLPLLTSLPASASSGLDARSCTEATAFPHCTSAAATQHQWHVAQPCRVRVEGTTHKDLLPCHG